MDIVSREEIIKYLEFEKGRFEQGKEYTGVITAIAPNLNKDATESLVCHLVKDGVILPQLKPIVRIERFPNKDVLVNNYHKLEVKATSTDDGSVTTSESNFEAFAWIWLETQAFFYQDSYIIPIHVITNPRICITSTRYVEALKQTKVSIRSVMKNAMDTHNYFRHNCNLKTIAIQPERARLWFNY